MLSDDPQLEEVRGWYIDGRRVHNPFASDATLVARFDAWLAEYVAAVRADQIEKDAAIVKTSIGSQWGIAAAIRAQPNEGNTNE